MHLVSALQAVALVAVLQPFCGAVRVYVPSCGPSRTVTVQNRPQAPVKPLDQNPPKMTEERMEKPVVQSVDQNPPKMTEERMEKPVVQPEDLNPPKMTEERMGKPVVQFVDHNSPWVTVVGFKRENQSQQTQRVPKGNINHLWEVPLADHTTVPSLIKSDL